MEGFSEQPTPQSELGIEEDDLRNDPVIQTEVSAPEADMESDPSDNEGATGSNAPQADQYKLAQGKGSTGRPQAPSGHGSGGEGIIKAGEEVGIAIGEEIDPFKQIENNSQGL